MAVKIKTKCPDCGGLAHIKTDFHAVQYKDSAAEVKVHGTFCQECKEVVLEGEETEKWEEAFFELRAKVEGVLSPKQVLAHRRILGLSQLQAGRLIGGGPRAFQKYESGESTPSVAMCRLLRLLVNDPKRLKELEEPAHAGA